MIKNIAPHSMKFLLCTGAVAGSFSSSQDLVWFKHAVFFTKHMKNSGQILWLYIPEKKKLNWKVVTKFSLAKQPKLNEQWAAN